MIPIVVGLFGLVVGRFLNVVVHRVPLRRSVVRPPSRCPFCEAHVKAFDNVPVLSYLILRVRCRRCKARISPRYTLVEALTGLLFGLAAYKFGLPLAFVLTAVLVTLAGIDLEHRLLPNAIVGPAAVVGFALSVAPASLRGGGFTWFRRSSLRQGSSRWLWLFRAGWGWAT